MYRCTDFLLSRHLYSYCTLFRYRTLFAQNLCYITSSGHMLPSTPKRLKDPNQKDAFRDFEADTCDAWDDGEDDLMAMAGTKLSIKDVQLTAMQVMDAHSKQVI